VTLTPKGEARRTALLDAVLRVLERDGPGAVTHRAVALEAGVPLSAATYYFATLDDLYVSALKRATAEEVALLGDLAGASLPEVAATLHAWAFGNRGAALAQYELMFLAMRRAALRPEAEAWYAALAHAIDPENLHPDVTPVRVLALDGLMLKMLWLGEPATPAGVEAALRQIVAVTSP
jgi:DNA-binding transcriptional regulator YbjK